MDPLLVVVEEVVIVVVVVVDNIFTKASNSLSTSSKSIGASRSPPVLFFYRFDFLIKLLLNYSYCKNQAVNLSINASNWPNTVDGALSGINSVSLPVSWKIFGCSLGFSVLRRLFGLVVNGGVSVVVTSINGVGGLMHR